MSNRTLKFSARWMSYKAPAYTLTELLVVLVIIGILVLLAMPNFGGVVTQAYETEAKLQLENLHGLQEAYYYQHHRYATDLAEIGFQQQKLVTDGGNARYRIEVAEVGTGTYRATATSTVDFDNDGTLNVWQIDHDNNLKRVVED